LDSKERATVTSAYENQLLGAFIYALGYECGRLGRHIPVNLFQQTPLDGTFGDLVAGADWCVALEFKRNWRSAQSELAKWPRAQLDQVLGDKGLREIARRAHFLCFGARDHDQVTIGIVRYLSFLRDPEGSKIQATRSAAMVHLLVNTTGLTKDASPIGVSPKALEEYLRRLSAIRKATGGSERPAEWLAVASGPEGYRIRPANSLDQLLEMDREQSKLRELKNQKNRDSQQDFEQER